MVNVIVAVILLIIIGAAIAYIIKEKKRGVKCIGCPAGGSCSGNCAGNCGGSLGCSDGCHSDAKVNK